MITNFHPQAYPLWIVDWSDPSPLVETVVGWTLAESGELLPISTGLSHGVVVVDSDRWTVYDDRAQAEGDAHPDDQ